MLRRRLAGLRHRHLYAVTDEVRARLQQLEVGVGRRAPALWTAGELRPRDSLGRACDLHVSDERIERALTPMKGSATEEILRAHGNDNLRTALALDELAIPPPVARAYYAPDDDLAYWLSGFAELLMIRDLVSLDGARILDFGCSSGRLLRHLHVQARPSSLIGVDVNVPAVAWARLHLPFTIAQGTFIPTLPLADASIDVAYAGSVFTHIDETEETWLCELRRVLRPGGTALISFHPERLWPEMLDPAHPIRAYVESMPHRMAPPGGAPVFDGQAPEGGERVVFTATEYPSSNANVIHSRDYVREHWGRLFAVERFVERAHGSQQDLVVLRRADS